MMKLKNVLATALIFAVSMSSHAQFYTTGSDSPSVRWMHFTTAHFNMIYPEGQDSLARAYALRLESIAPAGARRVPVILRNRTAYSNGLVVLPPLRMELQTIPDAYDPTGVPWETHLTLHEGEHLKQMTELMLKNPWKPLRFLFGGLSAGAGVVFETEQSLLEGEAVAAETAGTLSGRGRTADFLEYYRVSAGEGEQRSFYQWRYGSLDRYAPDYYRAGYIASAGGVRRMTALPGKRVRADFNRNLDSMARFWAQDELQRGPFTDSEPLMETQRNYLEYKSPVMFREELYAIRSGMTRTPAIIHIGKDGSEKEIQKLSSLSSRIRASEDRIFWSEYVPDTRWSRLSYSDIFAIDSLGRKQRLSLRQRYFNPSVSEDGTRLAASSYAEDGRSSIVVLDSGDGSLLHEYHAPAGMQVVETAWAGGRLYASTITEAGASILTVPEFAPLLPEEPVKIKELWTSDGNIMFTCDLSGVNELYELDPASSELRRKTSSRYGASDFCLSADGTLYFSAPQTGGRLLRSTSRDRLLDETVDFSDLAEYPLAPRTAAPAAALPAPETLAMSEPERYRQFPIMPHSWVPLYIDYDSVDDMSFYSLKSSVGLGATVFYQNTLGNVYGSAAIRARQRAGGSFTPAGEFNFTTTAFYPVIEARLRVNNRETVDYDLSRTSDSGLGGDIYSFRVNAGQRTSLNLNLKTYVPLNFSRGGFSTGVIPAVNLMLANDRFSFYGSAVPECGRSGSMSRMQISVRGYHMENIPESRIYPRTGIGAEIGFAIRPMVSEYFRPDGYASVYGYVPGFGEKDGFRLRTVYEHSFGHGILSEVFVTTTPRGFSSSSAASVAAGFRNRMLFSADYALPFASLDCDLFSPFAYIRNLELTPHIDYSIFFSPAPAGSLASIGADLCLRLGNLLWVPFPTRIGIGYNYNCGSLTSNIPDSGNHDIRLIFSVEL